MLFNIEKCVVMPIGTNNKLYSYNMNNGILKTVDVERDLGVIINKNETYSEQCLIAAKKANCVLGMIKISKSIGIIQRVSYNLPTSVLVSLYYTMVHPDYEYCNIIWDNIKS